MTPIDQAQSAATLQLTFNDRVDEPRTWRNRESGNHGTITRGREFTTSTGVRCYEYRERLVIDGREAVPANTACLSADGNWRRMAITATL